MEASSDAATETGHEHSSLTSTPRAISWKLYTSHFLSTWNSRSFEFCSVLFLAAIYPNTLLYLSIYAMIRSASAIVLAAPIGRAVDSRDRLAVVRFSIGTCLLFFLIPLTSICSFAHHKKKLKMKDISNMSTQYSVVCLLYSRVSASGACGTTIIYPLV